jgi:hypothetical protein
MRELLRRMLDPSPARRITARDAAAHPAFARVHAEELAAAQAAESARKED